MTYIVNWSRVWAAGIAFYFENEYFGWNRSPASDAEMICDLIILLIIALSVSRVRV